MTLGVSRLPCKYVPFKSSIYRKSLFVRFSNISRKTTFFSFCILMIHMILVIGRKQMHSTNYYGPFWSKRNLTAYFISDRIKIEKGTTDKRLVQRYMFTFNLKSNRFLGDMIPSSRTQKYKNLLGGILCPEKVKLMQ